MNPKERTMQASKIKPEHVYAIKNEGGQLVRFYVSAVVTRRERSTGSPHDFSSTVEGYVTAEDTGTGKRSDKRTLTPDAILGLYVEHVELVEREKREKAEAEAEEKAKAAAHEAQWRRLYELTGLPVPTEKKHIYGDALRDDHFERLHRRTAGFSIDDVGAEALIAALEKARAPEDVS
jgi:hypothetical protein